MLPALNIKFKIDRYLYISYKFMITITNFNFENNKKIFTEI